MYSKKMNKFSVSIILFLIVFLSILNLEAKPLRTGYELYEPSISRYMIYNNNTPPKSYLYSHCASLEWFDGKFYAIWNANNQTWEEGQWGQELALSTSTDFVNWTHPVNFVGPGYASNPRIDDPNKKQWQPNLMNYKGEELWCTWLGGRKDDRLTAGLFLTKLKKGEALWYNKKLNRLVSLYDEMPGTWSSQNPVLLDSGRVAVPIIMQGATWLPPEWKPQKPKWVGAIYSDDGGETWYPSNVVNIPHTIGGAWEPTVHDESDGSLRMFFRNITTWRTPGPKERLMTVSGTGSEKGEPMKFDPDGQFSEIETAHCRHGIIKLSSGRYCFIHHDLYSPSKAYAARRNGAIYFSRTGGDDFVASRAFIPSDVGVCAYPQGIEHDGKIYVIYTFREKYDPVPQTGSGGIQGAVIDPVPSADKFYIWPRDKDYLLMSGNTRLNPDYVYTRPYSEQVDSRNAIVFEDRGTAGVEIDGIDTSIGESLRVSFDIKVTDVQSPGNTVFCSFGDRIPIRLGLPDGFGGKMAAESKKGWEVVGDFSLNQWHHIEMVFGRNVFTVKLDGGAVETFMNPEFNPNTRFYLGDGYEVDEILSNKDSRFYIDLDSFETQVVEPEELTCIDNSRVVVEDYNGHVVVLDNPGNNWVDPATQNVIGSASVYFPFEGPDTGLGSEGWQNEGNIGTYESTSRAGSGLSPIISDSGIKGRCYDGRSLTPMSNVNGSYMYGEFSYDTAIEQSLIDIWSFTVTGWIWIDPSADHTQGRIFSSSPVELNYIMSNPGTVDENERFATRVENSSYTNSSYENGYYFAKGKWLFFAVTYDGTKSTEQLSYYFADENNTLMLDKKIDLAQGQIGYTGYGGNIWLGNTTNVNGERAFVGLIDELRIWSSKNQSSEGALSADEIELVRLYDLEASSQSGYNWDGSYNIVEPGGGSGPVEVFANFRSESYNVPCVLFEQGESFEIEFDAKVTNAQLFGYTVLCSYGSSDSAVRLAVPGDRDGRLYVFTDFGWEDVGEFTLNEWHNIKLSVSRNTVGVQIDSQEKEVFLTAVIDTECEFYFGNSPDIRDYILSNDESVFEIDYGSIQTAMVKATGLSDVCESQFGPIVKDATDNIYVLENTGNQPELDLGQSDSPYCVYYGTGGYPYNPERHVIADADVYLPFEGVEAGILSPAWKNKGQAAYNESPVVLGSSGENSPTTTSAGLKGRAYDGSDLREYRSENSYRWGHYNRENTYLEEGIANAKSMTISMWIKTEQYLASSYLLWTPSFELTHIGNWGNSYLRMTVEDSGYKNSSTSYGSIDTWRFLCVTYDGSKSTDNLSFYYGDENTPVTFDKSYSVPQGILEEDDYSGCPLFLGNSNVSGERPFVGFIDELRMWVDKEGSGGSLSVSELEMVRQWDLNGCFVPMNGDVNLDCYVNSPDISAIGSQWLSMESESDFNKDNFVDFEDLVILAQNWLSCSDPAQANCDSF